MHHLVILIALATVANTAKLPSTFTKCDPKQKNFNQCLTKAVENAIKQLNRPIKEVNLPNLEPLDVPSLVIGAGSGAVSFQQNYKNVKVAGLTKLSCENLNFNFDNKTLKMECTIPELRLDFQYEIKGKIMLLPIYGKGPGSITLNGLDFKLVFNLGEITKKGTKYFRVLTSNLEMDPKSIKFNFENLFDGDKALGDNINHVVNDNWKDVFLDVKSSYEEAFAKIFFAIFSNFLAKVPISEIF